MRARRRRPERHAARFLLAALLSAVLLLTLLLTAFGTWSAEPVATKPLATPAVLPGGQPLRQIVATAGGLHLQLPVSQSAVTAIGYHHAGDGSLMLDPIGRQGNAGLFARLWHKIAGTSETSLVWYQLQGDRGPGTSVLSVGAAPGTDVYSPVDGTVVGITRLRALEPNLRRTHRHPAARRAVRRRLDDAPPRRPGADRRLDRREGRDEGGHDRRPHVRRAPGARPVHAGRGQQRLAVGEAGRAAVGSLRILFVGDVVGAPGRRAVEERLPQLKEEVGAAFCIVNGENAADGVGITPKLAARIIAAGADVITLGNHTWRRSEIGPYLQTSEQVIRPANFSPLAPGRGLAVRQAADGTPVAVINLLGSLFLSPAVSMFELVDGLVEEARGQAQVIVVDVHAEATSEKVALAHWLDGKVTAVLGTHTHVQTSDARIQRGGTAALTDVGMTGPHDSVIGVKADLAIHRMRTGMPVRFEVAEGGVRIEGAVIDCDESGRATAIEPIRVDL